MVKEIWAPWRMEYILANSKEHDGCFLCEKAAQSNDEQNYVLYRSQHNFVIPIGHLSPEKVVSLSHINGNNTVLTWPGIGLQ